MDKDEILNRVSHHPPTRQEVVDNHESARKVISEAMKWLDLITTPSREQSLMFTKLEEALFWANADIARNQNK